MMHDVSIRSEMLDAALDCARRGWHVFPAPRGKKESFKSAKLNGVRWGATADAETLKAYFAEHRNACLGIACQESRIFVIEGDIKPDFNGVEWLAEKIEEHGDWPHTVEALSPSGSWHIYFRYPEGFDPKTCESEIAPGVDVRGHGGMVIAPPSVRPGAERAYRWKNPPGFFEVADCPEWLLAMVPRRGAQKQSNERQQGRAVIDTGGRSKTTHDFERLLRNTSIDGKKHGAVRDLSSSLAAQGVKRDLVEAIIRTHCPVWDEGVVKSIDSAYDKFRGSNFRHTELELIRDDKDRPIWNMANAITLLSNHEDWRGVLAYNEFSARRVLLRPVPGQSDIGFPRPLEDDDYSAAQAWFNKNGFPKANAEISQAAIRKVCRMQSFDPLRDYLAGLQWDGTKRLGTWLSSYCGAEPSAYTSEVGIRWCISAVARGFEPGCKADHMLVLEGEQGRRKSTALAALAGPDWFSDSLPQMGTKDASSYLRGKWIIEVGELEAMRKEVDAIKAFISRQVESFRPAYGREEVNEPRRCIFAGTTNKNDWQRDETGGRRFWPVKVGVIDVAAIERDKDQLWAEAVALYRQGERWWLEGEAAELAQAEVSERMPDDPWRGDISAAVKGRSEVTTKEVLAQLGVLQSDMTTQLSKRVAKELIGLGWQRDGRVTSGANKGAIRYVPGEGG